MLDSEMFINEEGKCLQIHKSGKNYICNDVQTSKASEYCYCQQTFMPMFLTGCETEMPIWKYGWE